MPKRTITIFIGAILLLSRGVSLAMLKGKARIRGRIRQTGIQVQFEEDLKRIPLQKTIASLNTKAGKIENWIKKQKKIYGERPITGFAEELKTVYLDTASQLLAPDNEALKTMSFRLEALAFKAGNLSFANSRENIQNTVMVEAVHGWQEIQARFEALKDGANKETVELFDLMVGDYEAVEAAYRSRRRRLKEAMRDKQNVRAHIRPVNKIEQLNAGNDNSSFEK